MEIGMLGLPKSGKTTLFNALTGMDASVSAFATGGSMEPNVAVVKVPDPRVDRLADMFVSKKKVYATIKYVDMPGVSADAAAQSKGLPEAHLNHLGITDALVVVIRAFTDASGIETNPIQDLDAIGFEMLLSDMQKVENRLPRLERSLINAKGADRDKLTAEKSALEKIKERLDREEPIRGTELTPEEEKAVRGFQFLSQKPMLVVFNLSEDDLTSGRDWIRECADRWQPGLVMGAQLCASAEMEISRLDEEEREIFLADYGIDEPAADKIIQWSYELLGLISFLTTGPDESRAWTIHRGTPAPQAAGAIHSDIERGFIRAETVQYDDLIAAGSMAEAKKAGTVRLEGKNYVVADGDIINFRFNV